MERISEDLRTDLMERATSLKRTHSIDVDIEAEQQAIVEAGTLIGSCVTNTVELLSDRMRSGKSVLIEGAQATMLDIDHGTYPYVTSSATTVAGALQGLGLPPQCVREVIGVAKAYCTRVGSGDFLTEVDGATGDRLRERGGEYGSVTKRPRRCGWLHIPDLQRSAMINGCTCWNITKLDVLDTEEIIQVGVGESQGKAVYKEFAGWKTSTAGMTTFADLPKQAQNLALFIEQETGIPVTYIGTGQGRGEMIVR
jgi:adenylosuccinate synthase